MKNKKAWIKIVEAFTVILLIAVVFLIIIGKNEKSGNGSERIYEDEIAILREIQLDYEIREEISNAPGASLPVAWENFDSLGLKNIKAKVIQKTPGYLNCEAMLCNLIQECILENSEEKNIYVKSVFISTTMNREVYRQLKLFCWEKG